MRILTLICILLAGIAIAGGALAEEIGRGEGPAPGVATTLPDPVAPPVGHHLKLSPLFIEILAIEERTRTTELFLLKELAETTDAAEAGRIVRRLERLDNDRRLHILELRMKRARETGHYDLAHRLRVEMVEIMAADMQAMK